MVYVVYCSLCLYSIVADDKWCNGGRATQCAAGAQIGSVLNISNNVVYSCSLKLLVDYIVAQLEHTLSH